jgi:hypothetical protein
MNLVLWPNALREIVPGDLLHNGIFAGLAAIGFLIRRRGRHPLPQR